jgi:hypothetical protein
MLEHETGLIRTSELLSDPYPHLLVDDFLDSDLYEGVLKHFPTQEQLIKGGDFSKQLDLVVDPGVARADESWSFTQHMEGEQLQFWMEFKEAAFDSNVLGAAFLDKFSISKSLDDVYTCGRIQVEELGSGLGPHRDRFDKLVSCVIYLDECPEACGTMLLAPKHPNLFEFEDHLSYGEFNVVDEVEHKPNRMICWPVVQNSFHSYYQNKKAFRKTIKLFVQEKQDVDALRARIAKTKKTANKWREDVDSGTA